MVGPDHRSSSPLQAPQHASSVVAPSCFLVRNTIVEQLRAHGYDATSTTAPANSSYRAPIVSGTFRAVAEVALRNN
jgi:hypothetical protein